jgi:pyrimidine-nucleoside phosphorylase
MSKGNHSMIDLIRRKRDGGELEPDELRWIVAQYTADVIPDYQVAALLMAIVWRGMTPHELAPWTEAMLHSGDVLDFSHVEMSKVDKHSTGGVGDKVSIPLAPMVAACGVAVPMMSGRGLGHTGGTLDKLESIPGFRTALDRAEFTAILERHNMVMGGQSESLVPADRRLYALRDATGTVESIPLISSSIMSKKLSEDLDALVLDVKVGSGAFMKDLDRARELARTMVGIGASHDTEVVALLTDMNQPLGDEVGNACEIAESLDVLAGGGPPDLVEIVYRLGAEMLVLGGAASDLDQARVRLEGVVADGSAMDTFAAVIADQGGNPAVVEDRSLLDVAPYRHNVVAPRDGYVTRCDALDVGNASVRLGGGRARKEDDVDHGVGITVRGRPGDAVAQGDVLAEVRYRDENRLAAALPLLDTAWSIGDEAPAPTPLVLGEVR